MTENSTTLEKDTSSVSIPRDIERYLDLGVLDLLLTDHSTEKNIIWATSAYEKLGEGFGRRDEIKVAQITEEHAELLKRRAQKDKDEKTALTRVHAEVFTPAWIVKFMVDAADEAWREGRRKKSLSDGWQSYVSSNRLEITCGEAPYLVNRYDAADGSVTPIAERAGILSRKLALVNENAKTRATWVKWAKTALKSIYGYEYQGDNLLIARINVLCTMEDYLKEAGYEGFAAEEYEDLANIISWNLWQMDGLTKCVPFGKSIKDAPMPSLFDAFEEPKEEVYSDCLIYDWEKDESIKFSSIRRGSDMKFDYIIGNPPYQEEQEGDNETFAPPVYHRFMDGAYDISDKVELITPARFLFDAGSTPKAWNQKMLGDPHLKVAYYEADSSKVFPGTDIKGGVAVTYHDVDQNYGSIKTFSAFPQMNRIMKKVSAGEDNLTKIIYIQNRFNLDALYCDYPNAKKSIGSNGKDRRFEKNIFTKVSEVFSNAEIPDSIKVLGIVNNKRVWRYIPIKYVDLSHENINKWKVLIPTSNGSGALGEVLSTPLIGAPLIGFTRSFIAIGAFETESEASAALKYVKSKFCRVLLGALKVTQDNNKDVWRLIPLQDFSSSSDIDWSQSVAEIDEQLYKKYGFSPEEIEFIETHVKAMD